MKLRIFSIFSLLLGTTFLIIGCPAKTVNPTSPSGPANTPTVTDSPTITLSPTQTGTPTNSFTPTTTRTSTNTATVTDTPTATNSATNSATPTFTGTPTNSATATETFTITDTATVTDTATLTLTLTETLSPTNTETATGTPTPTNTGTFTNSPTITATATVTNSPTATPNLGTYSISGTLNYSGSDVSITAGHPALIEWSASSNGSSPTMGATVTSNGGSYGISLPSAGTYYLIAIIGGANYPACQSVKDFQGEVYQFYGGSCSSGTAIDVTGNTTGANFSFGDSCGQETGVSGGVTYTGGLTTNFSANNICIFAYSNSSYTTRVGPEYNVTCNDTTYSLGTGGTSTLYLEAFVALDGNDGGPDAGDPYIQLGAFTPSTSLVIPINFGDTNIYGTTPTPTVTPSVTPTPVVTYTIGGTVNYSGSYPSVSAGHPIVVICALPGLTGIVSATTVSSNGGSYSLTAPAGSYNVLALIGPANLPPCQSVNLSCETANVGTQGFVGGFFGGATATTVNVTTSNVTGDNFTFNDTTIASDPFTGMSGGITYTGSLGTVSSAHPLVIVDFSDAGYTQHDDGGLPREITCNNTTYSYHFPSGDYFLAFYDLQGNGTWSTGDPYIELGNVTQNLTAGNEPINFDDTNIK